MWLRDRDSHVFAGDPRTFAPCSALLLAACLAGCHSRPCGLRIAAGASRSTTGAGLACCHTARSGTKSSSPLFHPRPPLCRIPFCSAHSLSASLTLCRLPPGQYVAVPLQAQSSGEQQESEERDAAGRRDAVSAASSCDRESGGPAAGSCDCIGTGQDRSRAAQAC